MTGRKGVCGVFIPFFSKEKYSPEWLVCLNILDAAKAVLATYADPIILDFRFNCMSHKSTYILDKTVTYTNPINLDLR